MDFPKRALEIIASPYGDAVYREWSKKEKDMALAAEKLLKKYKNLCKEAETLCGEYYGYQIKEIERIRGNEILGN